MSLRPVTGGGKDMTDAAIVVSPDDVLKVTFSTDTNAYADGDLLADTQMIADAFRVAGGTLIVQSLVLLDADDQAGALDVVFLNRQQSLGTENSAASVADLDAATAVLGHVPVAATDYSDLGGCQVATVRNVGLMLKAAEGSTALYVALMSQDAKTYTAAGLSLKIGVMRN
jgi:hypothetical protein